MFTLYIAEKDPHIIDRLCSGADWSMLSVQLLGQSSDGETALAELLRLRPDLVMLDTELPRLSGADVLRRARILGFMGACILLFRAPSFHALQPLLPLGVRGCLSIPEDLPQLQPMLKEVVLRLKQERMYRTAALSLPADSDIANESLPPPQFPAREISQAVPHSSRNSILDDLLLYIESHYPENLKLEVIAPLFGYSSAYLGKIFTKNVGESFNSYVDHCRIEHAKELLKNEKWKVYEVAAQVGYRSVDYFHKKFHHYVGMSPLEYRRQQVEDS